MTRISAASGTEPGTYGAEPGSFGAGPGSFTPGNKKKTIQAWFTFRFLVQLGPLGGHLGPKGVQKGNQKEVQEGSQTKLNPGSKQNLENASWRHYLQCFSHVERSKKTTFCVSVGWLISYKK